MPESCLEISHIIFAPASRTADLLLMQHGVRRHSLGWRYVAKSEFIPHRPPSTLESAPEPFIPGITVFSIGVHPDCIPPVIRIARVSPFGGCNERLAKLIIPATPDRIQLRGP